MIESHGTRLRGVVAERRLRDQSRDNALPRLVTGALNVRGSTACFSA